MNKTRTLLWHGVLLSGLLAGVWAVADQVHAQAAAPPASGEAAPKIDPKADELLRQACQTVASAQRFSFAAHCTSEHVLRSGQKLHFAQNELVRVRRPDALSAIVDGDRDRVRFWYDGTHVGLYNPRENVFSIKSAPPTIDATLDMLATRFDMALPLSDLMMSDPYKALREHVTSALDLGRGYVFDAICHHLAFRQENVDWEIWVSEGEHPLPRKLVIVGKASPEFPEFTAYLSEWNLAPDFSAATFESPAPKGAKELPFSRGQSAPATQPAPAQAK